MEQLKVKDILQALSSLQAEGKISREEILEMPVYIGDDDELNGIHCAWGIDTVHAGSADEGEQYLADMINNTSGNIPFKNVAFLIS